MLTDFLLIQDPVSSDFPSICVNSSAVLALIDCLTLLSVILVFSSQRLGFTYGGTTRASIRS